MLYKYTVHKVTDPEDRRYFRLSMNLIYVIESFDGVREFKKHNLYIFNKEWMRC